MTQHKQLIALDPDFGENSPMPTAGYFAQSLTQAEYSVSDLALVVISHSHPDHIGNLMTDGAATFPNAEIVNGRTEFEFWKRGEQISDMRQPTLKMSSRLVFPLSGTIPLQGICSRWLIPVVPRPPKPIRNGAGHGQTGYRIRLPGSGADGRV